MPRGITVPVSGRHLSDAGSLAAGDHTIHFTASWPDGNGLDVTYNLTVLE